MTSLRLRNGFEIYLKEMSYNRILEEAEEEDKEVDILIFGKDFPLEDFPFDEFQDLIYENRLYIKKF